LAILIALAAVLPARVSAATYYPTIGCDVPEIQNTAPGDTTILYAQTEFSPVRFCHVVGAIATNTAGQDNTVIFDLEMPDVWYGGLLFLGNGGFGGSLQAVDSGGSAFNLQFGWTVAATDTGHESSAGAYGFLDGSFALINGQPNLAAREDWESRSVHVSTQTSQIITSAYYQQPYPLRYASFFYGCSTGGRQALVEAQEFPFDFRGIVSGDPGIGDPVAAFNWNAQTLLKSSAGYLSPSDIQLVDQAVLAECDGVDGVVDGLIQDPRKCNFDPKSLMCTGSSKSNCLNNQQVKTLQAIFSGAVTNGNAPLYPGYEVSDLGGDDGWSQWISGFDPPQFDVAEPWGAPPGSFDAAPWQWSSQDQYLKYFVFNDPNYDSLNFNLRHKADVDALLASDQFHSNPGTNLSSFFAWGGKLIMYHGWSDPALTPQISIDYYTGVANQLYGGNISQLQQNNAQLYLVPGMHHCGGGPGPNVFDALSPVIFWQDYNGSNIPQNIIATHYVNNDPSQGVDRTMPLCPYPQVATLGSGAVNVASSWTCANPAGR
jgi:Tannase and feruloyl esterase